MDQSEEKELWLRYWTESDIEARELLIEKFSHLAKRISAAIFKNRPDNEVPFDDYYQFGLVGLLEALDRFRLDKNVSFETYATYRISGSILDGVEKLTEKRTQISYRARLRKERIDSLNSEDSSNKEDLFWKMVDVSIDLVLSYMLEDSCIYQNKIKLSEDINHKITEFSQFKKLLAKYVEELPEKERLVVYYHYFEDTSFKVISEMLDISKGRVSQIHKKALKHIRDMISKKSYDDFF